MCPIQRNGDGKYSEIDLFENGNSLNLNVNVFNPKKRSPVVEICLMVYGSSF